VITKNPFQTGRLQEIAAGGKFWGYLDTAALQSRYVLAAHFVRDCPHVVEIGGYRQNLITNFLREPHESVSVFSLDAEFDPLERDTLNGAPCRVRHVQDHFQQHPLPAAGVGVVALGLEIHGDFGPFCELVRSADVTVIEVPIDHAPSLACLDHLQRAVPLRTRCRIDLDLSANEPLLRDELQRTNMNRPFWRRSLVVLDPAGNSDRETPGADPTPSRA
jgi:hypothetical protein